MRLPKVCTIALGLLSLAGPLAVSSPAQAGAARGRLIPNSTRYGDRGLRPATGRAGSVTLSARALYARDGAAELEVTTGQFDGRAPATGVISKVVGPSADERTRAAGPSVPRRPAALALWCITTEVACATGEAETRLPARKIVFAAGARFRPPLPH